MNRYVTSSEELEYRVRLGEARLALELALDAGERPVVSSKFGPDSAVLLHLVTTRLPDVPVLRVESGYDTRATRRHVDAVTERLGLNLHVFRAVDHVVRIPPALDDPEHTAFAEEVKLAPFRRALETLGADVWLSGIRRYQSAHRAGTTTFATLGSGVLKVSPLLGWSEETVRRYAREHDLKAIPSCPFAASYVERHPEWEDVVVEP